MDKKIHDFKLLQGVSGISSRLFNLSKSLEMLNRTADVDVQVKLFSILSAYLMLNDDNVAEIITFNPLYDKISKILTHCHPRKTVVALNFLSALLYVEQDSDRKRSLVVYAKNMIRSSGCLATMCEMFTRCMMHQDTWQALCRCLAEACREMEDNQSYCTHIIPMCVQRGCLRNMEVLQVLQSLLQNHHRNINLFIESNGISLFRREILQYDVCLQIIATLVQSSDQAVELIVKTNICQQLRNFLHMYEPQSQLRQWATVILYHTSRAEASAESKDGDLEKINHKLDKSLFTKTKPHQIRDMECSGNTTNFYQNVMKELIHCGKEDFKKDVFPSNISMNSYRNALCFAPRVSSHNILQKNSFFMPPHQTNNSFMENPIQTESLQFNKTNELSFSFLRKKHMNKRFATSKTEALKGADKNSDNFQGTLHTNRSNVIVNTARENYKEINKSCFDFKPKFASTPKKISKKEYSRREKHRYNTIKKDQIKRRGRLDSKRSLNHFEQSDIDKEIKHRSLSGRVFDVINTSCTTLMKTVKNIFRPKPVNETKENSTNKSSNRETLPCSYSFTNYMYHRDAILNNKSSNPSDGSLEGSKSKTNFEDFSMEKSNNSCNTCNDTTILKRKLINNNHLKQTIRKLKLGINLYGCDFKKISRVMWPNEKYMTPAVIYNLYRKLIIK